MLFFIVIFEVYILSIMLSSKWFSSMLSFRVGYIGAIFVFGCSAFVFFWMVWMFGWLIICLEVGMLSLAVVLGFWMMISMNGCWHEWILFFNFLYYVWVLLYCCILCVCVRVRVYVVYLSIHMKCFVVFLKLAIKHFKWIPNWILFCWQWCRICQEGNSSSCFANLVYSWSWFAFDVIYRFAKCSLRRGADCI